MARIVSSLLVLLAGAALLTAVAPAANPRVPSLPATPAAGDGATLPYALAWRGAETAATAGLLPALTAPDAAGCRLGRVEHGERSGSLATNDSNDCAGADEANRIGISGLPVAVAASRQVAPAGEWYLAVEAGRPLTADEIADLTAAFATDLDGFWTRAFVAEGRFYGRAAYILIDGMTPSPCAGDGGVRPGVGSFYCPWNQTVYLDLATLLTEAGSYGRAGLLFTLAHEWGHHAQFQRGDLTERSAEVELAADCLAGAYLADAVGRGLLSAEVVEEELSVAVLALGDPRGMDPADARAHGTGEQRAAMLLLGYADGAAACVA